MNQEIHSQIASHVSKDSFNLSNLQKQLDYVHPIIQNHEGSIPDDETPGEEFTVMDWNRIKNKQKVDEYLEQIRETIKTSKTFRLNLKGKKTIDINTETFSLEDFDKDGLLFDPDSDMNIKQNEDDEFEQYSKDTISTRASTAIETVIKALLYYKQHSSDLKPGPAGGGKRKKRSKTRRKNKKSRKSVKSRKSQKKRKSRKRMKTRKKRK